MSDLELIRSIMANVDELQAKADESFRKFVAAYFTAPIPDQEMELLRLFFAAGYCEGYGFSTTEFELFLSLKRARDQSKRALE